MGIQNHSKTIQATDKIVFIKSFFIRNMYTAKELTQNVSNYFEFEKQIKWGVMFIHKSIITNRIIVYWKY